VINIVGKGALDSCTYLLQIQISVSVHNPLKMGNGNTLDFST